jgi:hypothetical protein
MASAKAVVSAGPKLMVDWVHLMRCRTHDGEVRLSGRGDRPDSGEGKS